MRVERVWLPVAALALVLGTIVLYRVVAQQGDVSQTTFVTTARSVPVSLSESLGIATTGTSDENTADHGRAEQVDFDPLLDGAAVHADAVDVPVPVPLPPAAPRRLPAELPPTHTAHPIDTHTADAERQLNELIARELSDLPEQQQSVWREVLQGLPTKEAEEILQIWKLTGRIGSPAPAVTLPSDEVLPLLPASSPPTGAVPPAVAELVRHNLAHVDSPGFLRSLPDATGGRPAVLDLSPGELQRTGNPLHLAIEGPGFFRLQQGAQVTFTRCGAFDLNAERELIQPSASGDWSLSPAIRLPADAAQIVVTASGEVSVRRRTKSAELEPCGQIQLVLFLNPQRLERADGALLRESATSGEPLSTTPGAPGGGRLLQGALERANATLATEAAVLDGWSQRSALLERLSPANAQ